MFFMPFALLPTLLLGLLSLALLGGAGYLLWAWYVGAVVGTGYLAASLAMILWTFLGRWVVLSLLRGPGPDEPGALPSDSVVRLPRPDGTELHVEIYGPPDAPPIVLTHGAGANSTSWYYAKRHLADRFRLIVWDFPGVGRSRGPESGDYSLEKHARDLEAVLSVAGDRPAVLVGHSMGGMTVLTFCRLFPEALRARVAGLVLVDTSDTNPVRTTTLAGLLGALQKPLLEPLLHLVVWLSPLVRLMQWLGYVNGSSHLTATLTGFAGSETRGQLDLATRYTALTPPAVVARQNLAMFRYDATEILGSLPVPVLLITGHLDRMIVPETSRRMGRAIPGARLETLEPAGHMAIFERHERFVAALGAFGARCTRPDPEAAPLHPTA
jgi:pimeloyl-ACP methyl ester carboxylesterase